MKTIEEQADEYCSTTGWGLYMKRATELDAARDLMAGFARQQCEQLIVRLQGVMSTNFGTNSIYGSLKEFCDEEMECLKSPPTQ